MVALALPLVLIAGWLFFLRADHQRQQESFDVFDRYYQSIPDSKLGEPFFTRVDETDSDNIVMCADLGKQDGTDYICAEMNLGLPDGKQVVGGFEARDFDGPEHLGDALSSFVVEPHDCWGEVSVCDE